MNLLIFILFTQFIPPYETKVLVNWEANFIIYARFYQGNLIGIDSIIAIPEYFTSRLQKHNQRLLLSELKREMTKKGGYANRGLIGTFEIPLPKGGFSEFMGETGKLDVGGYVKITLGGSETFISNYPGMERPSLLPELEMNQEMAVNVDGQVGDRMEVYIDHNSTRVDETQNKIRVTYKGKEDEIIQEIEGGDTYLSIPATTYTGDIPSHQGLFGIKSTAKLGPLDLVAIASKEQTQSQEMTIEGAISADSGIIWAKAYEKRRFFWLGNYDKIITLQVYVDDRNNQNNMGTITYSGVACPDHNDNNQSDDTTKNEKGNFTFKKEGSTEDYEFLRGPNIIQLSYRLGDDEILGVYYKKIKNGDTITVGRLPTQPPGDTTIQLKLICPPRTHADTLSPTWHYELKNYYQLVTPGSRLDSLRIYYIKSGGERTDRNDQGTPFIEVLGLDQNKDGIIDENIVFFPSRGLLIFPDSLPFASAKLADPDPEIYKNPWMIPTGKYYLYKKTIAAKPVYELPPNTIHVSVWVNEQLQDSTQHYHVDYEQGRLEFKKPIMPGDKIRIKVEYSPFFSLSQKSLLGLRTSMKTFGQGTLGSSFFYRNESYPTIEHLRLREEPFDRMVLETDFSLPQNLPFLTSLIDWLPLIETEAESKFNLNFEGAYSFSNLNSAGGVYLDDMETSTTGEDISLNRIEWVLSSKPAGLDTANFVKKRIIWYNPPEKERPLLKDIYQNPIEPDKEADVLKIIFEPNDDALSYGGLTQYLYTKNFDECENLEVIIKGGNGRIHIDIAQEINEDQLRRNRQGTLVGIGTYEDEDQVSPKGTWTQDKEDTGLDSVFGDDNSNIPNDDGNDDYQREDYTGRINGTENNNLWDTEDIDRNGFVNEKDWYYSYSINLDSIRFLVENAGLKPGWKMFRVPIKDSLIRDTTVGQVDWHNIRYVRVWFDHFTQQETLYIYKLSITGSRWKNYSIGGISSLLDSTESFTLTPVNTETHTYYKSPYPPEIDPITGKVKIERALEFKLQNIKEGHTCIAHRPLEENEDYRAYDSLSFFLKALHTNPLISFRFGSSDSVYYEYTTEYNSGIKGYNDYRLFKIYLSRFLALKKESEGKGTITEGNYTVVGNPSLSLNRFFEIRITNQFATPLSDTIWFDDVKLVSPRNEIGRTLRANGAIQLADLSSLSFAFDESDGRFKRLTDTKEISTRSAGKNYGVNANLAFNKFLPNTWGFNIPMGLSYRKSTALPRFAYFANDLELKGEEQEKQKETSISSSQTLHISKSNSKNFFLKQTLDRLSFDHDRTQVFSQTALSCDTSRVKNYHGSYSLDPKFSFKIFNQAFSVLPQHLSLQAVYTDNFARSYYRLSPDSVFRLTSYGSQQRKTLNPSFSASYSPHLLLNTGFNFSQSRDSVSEKRKLGEEVGRNQSFNANLTKDLKVISPSLAYSSGYTEDHRFEIRETGDYRNVSNNARYSINSQVDIKRVVRFFTQLRDETKDSLQIPGSPMWILGQIEKFMDYLQNPSVNFSRQKNSSYLKVEGRPDLRYRWGITDSIPKEDIGLYSYPGRGMTDNYGINSGMNYKFISLQSGYNGQVSRQFIYGAGYWVGENRTVSRSYPNANLRLARIEAIPFLKKFTHSSSISSGFNQSLEYRYVINGDSIKLDSDSKTASFSPLLSWQTNWVKGITTTADINYSETNSHQYSEIDIIHSRSLNRGGSISLAYTFSAPKGLNFPFLKGLRFASNLSTNVSIGYSRSTGYSQDLRNPTNDASTLTSNIGLSYSFSASVTGGASFDYAENKEENSNQDSKRVGLNIWTNINF